MPQLEVTLHSEVLGRDERVVCFFPNPSTRSNGADAKRYVFEPGVLYQTIWLLNSEVGNQWDWPQRTTAWDTVDSVNMIAVCPYIRELTGAGESGDYMKYLAVELPEKLGRILPVSMEKQDNFLAAPSWGAYFALRTAMRYPQRYASVCAMSGPLDVVSFLKQSNKADKAIELENTDFDLKSMLRKNGGKTTPMPVIFCMTGTDDDTYASNISFVETLRETEHPYFYFEGRGKHDWAHWSSYLRIFVEQEQGIRWAPIHPNR